MIRIAPFQFAGKASLATLIAANALMLLAACGSGPELLNSERIERQFGSYAVEVLEASERQRVSSLFSIDATGKTCRTFAVVDFDLPVDRRLSAEHAEITGGGSIGEVFSNSGWSIRKTTLDLDEVLAASDPLDIAEHMRVGRDAPLARHRYRFEVTKNGTRIPYATITEIHHPDYLRLPQLLALYGRP